MHIRRWLASALLATSALSAQAAIDLVVQVNPSHFDPDHLSIPPQEPLPGAFDLSFTIDTQAPLNASRQARSASAEFALHTDPSSPVHDRLTMLSSIWVRTHMLKDGTATLNHQLLSGVAPSRTSLVLKTADAFQMPDAPLSAYDYSRTVKLSALNPFDGDPAAHEMLLDEAAIASWLTARIGENFAGAYSEAIKRSIGNDRMSERTLWGDVTIKSVTVVPEPSSAALCLIGMIAIGATSRARRRATS